jgi:hypothetical protein
MLSLRGEEISYAERLYGQRYAAGSNGWDETGSGENDLIGISSTQFCREIKRWR